MSTGRFEAFTDAVIAIILTIMVLELHPPDSYTVAEFKKLAPTFLSYILSFVFLAIYWNNHHHMMHAAEKVDGAVLWANMHLLFWLSLIPFVTVWISHGLDSVSAAAYGLVLIFSGIAYYILARLLLRCNGPDSRFAKGLGSDAKGKISVVIYAIAIALAFVWPPLACTLYVGVALMWLVPDKRFSTVEAGGD